MFKRLLSETKHKILEKVKNGMIVTEAARQYALSTKTIYTWLSNQVLPEISIIEYNRYFTVIKVKNFYQKIV